MRTVLTLLLPAFVAACGYKGALYLPSGACGKNCDCAKTCSPPSNPTQKQP